MPSIILLWMSVYLIGILINKISGEKETSQLWIHLTGFFFLFFSQGFVFTAGQFLGWNFSRARGILALVIFLASLLGCILGRKEIGCILGRIRQLVLNKERRVLCLALVGWLWLGIWLALSSGMVMNRQDGVIEIAKTTLLTDTMNEVHPFTGQVMELGVIPSKKIQTLPFWYAALREWTGFSLQDTVWVWGSFFTITFSLMAFTRLASLLFGKEQQKTWMFACVMELLILSGDYVSSAGGYRLLFYGYSGETIVGFVLLPAVLAILYNVLTPWFHGGSEQPKQSVWGASLQLGLVLGTSVFLAPLRWGFVLLLLTLCLGLVCLGVILLVKKMREEKLCRRLEK